MVFLHWNFRFYPLANKQPPHALHASPTPYPPLHHGDSQVDQGRRCGRPVARNRSASRQKNHALVLALDSARGKGAGDGCPDHAWGAVGLCVRERGDRNRAREVEGLGMLASARPVATVLTSDAVRIYGHGQL